MPTLRARDREFHTLAAGQVLTVATAAASAGIVRQYPDTGFNATSSQAVGASSTLTVGPFTGSVRLGVECSLGQLDWSAGLPTSFPAPALSDNKVAAVDSLVSDDGIQASVSNLTAAVGSAGVLTGAYYYTQTFVTALGETAPWPGTATVVNPSSQQVNLTAIPLGPAGTIARRIYRTPAISGTGDPKDYRLVAAISDNTTTTYTDNLADGSLGAPANWNATNRGRFRDAAGLQFAAFSDQSTAIGQGTFNANTGYASTAVGYQALNANTSGRRNTAVGVYSFTALTTGYANTGIGVHSGNYLTTGAANTFLGYAAGFNSTGTCNNNVAVGYQAMNGSGSALGQNNTAVGYRALGDINTADGCVALGFAAGKYASASRWLYIDSGGDRATDALQKDYGLISGRGQATASGNTALQNGTIAGTQEIRINAPVRLGWATAVVASLPAVAGFTGFRAWVSDASVAYTGANIGTTVVGGGANVVPVFCNGTNWVIG